MPNPTNSLSGRSHTPWIWWGLALVLALLDQGVKGWIEVHMTYLESMPIASFFNLVHVRNTGAAFSFLADAGGWQRYFFVGLALIVAFGLMWWLRKPMPTQEALAYSFILGGAVGNVIDRITRGFVVDFLDFYWRDWHWPAFNLADVGICMGTAMLIVGTLPSVRTAHTPTLPWQ